MRLPCSQRAYRLDGKWCSNRAERVAHNPPDATARMTTTYGTAATSGRFVVIGRGLSGTPPRRMSLSIWQPTFAASQPTRLFAQASAAS